MLVWIDAQLPPVLATRLREVLAVDAHHVLTLGLVHAKDESIFQAAREANAILLTNDSDFVRLLERSGPPPRVLWITLGNASNTELWSSLQRSWGLITGHLAAGEPLVEIGHT